MFIYDNISQADNYFYLIRKPHSITSQPELNTLFGLTPDEINPLISLINADLFIV